MGTHKSARIQKIEGSADITTTMSYFVRNHKDDEQLFTQMKALYASGQLSEVSTLAQCIIDEYKDLVQNVEFFILSVRTEIELNGLTEKAQELLKQALKVCPKNDLALAYFKMFKACGDLKDGLYESGEKTLIECFQFSELRAYAQFFLGHHLFWKKNDVSEALKHLEACVKERSSFLSAWTDLALVYKRQGERLKANHAWQTCLKIDRNLSRKSFYQKHLERI